MKTKILFLLTSIIYLNTYAQISFQDHIVTTMAYGAFSVYAADIDGDGDMDVLSTSGDNKVAWYENTDGQGSFGDQQVITTNVNSSYSVYTSDIDRDGDMDVLSSSYSDSEIAWYENTDGLGSFGDQQVIASDVIGATMAYPTDINGDGDMDVLAASWNENKIIWFENTDGQGGFGDQQVISTNESAYTVYPTDIDGDGDMDVLATSYFDSKIAWHENTDGLGSFGDQQVITANASGAHTVYSTDIDGDGDMDVISASEKDNKIAWYENTDGLGSFGDQQVITTSATSAISVYAADMDGDGDMDVISASEDDNKIAWYENTDGLGSFGDQLVITTNALGAYSVYSTDIDGDGDMDVLSASYNDNKIAWYENISTLGVSENSLAGFSVYPIPTTDILTVQSDFNIVLIEIYNISGQLVLSNSNQNKIDISSVRSGLYFIKLKDEHGYLATNKVMKK